MSKEFDKPVSADHLVADFDEPFVDPAMVAKEAKIPKLLRKAGRGTAAYAASYLAVKALDKAAEMNPHNELIKDADEVARGVYFFENLIVDTAITAVATGYDALTRPKEAAPLEVVPALPEKPKHSHRNRANLNAALAPKTDSRDPNQATSQQNVTPDSAPAPVRQKPDMMLKP